MESVETRTTHGARPGRERKELARRGKRNRLICSICWSNGLLMTFDVDLETMFAKQEEEDEEEEAAAAAAATSFL